MSDQGNNSIKTSALKDFVEGFSLPLKTAKLIFKVPGIIPVAAIPVLINLVLFVGAIFLSVYWIGAWDVDPGDFSWGLEDSWKRWCSDAINWTLEHGSVLLKWVILLPLIAFTCYSTFSMVGLVVASPFNDMLSERIENHLCGEKEPTKIPLRLNIKMTLFSIYESLTIALKQLGFLLLCLPLALIPLVGFIPLILVNAWFTGVGNCDMGMARNNLHKKHKAVMLSEHKFKIFGIGLAMELLFMIPFLNLFLIPFGASAGTFLYCSMDWEERFKRGDVEAPEGFRVPKISNDIIQ